MAPQVDVISQNVSENIRREQARELAASVVQALFRLVKLSTLHAIDNQAMVRQVEETARSSSPGSSSRRTAPSTRARSSSATS
jgi:hypothetical protein